MTSFTEDLKARINLVELIGRDVALQRTRGGRYVGLCPFHDEKTPSFFVNPYLRSWRCYGCVRSGTVFDWLYEREGLTFAEAVTALQCEAAA